MFRLSKLTDYATVIMTFMARHADLSFTARDIAEKTHINLPTVSKILKQLTQAGLLNSQRGTHGGYQLAKSPADISLATLIDIMENNSSMVECGKQSSQCQLEPYCFIKGNWRLISQAITNALNNISLADLAAPMQPFTVNVPIKTLAINTTEETS